ncbi:MAG: LysE family translocator [Gammaproteobacteria bacterium]
MNYFIPLLLFAVSTTFTPGPNNLMIMNSGLHFGIKKSLPHYFGICFGFPAMVLIVALGLGAIFMQYSWIKQGLKILGSAYMLYLAWQILRSNNKANLAQIRKPLSFLQAVMFQWVNPKAWLMAISTISIFTLSSNYCYNAAIISIVYLLMCLPCIGAWLLFGKFLQRILTKDSHRVWFNILMALSLVASIGMIIFD